MKKKQTTKHRKQRKKELANRKAKQHQRMVSHIDQMLAANKEQRMVAEEQEPDASPMSPARRAFQNM